ncbi:MAG: transposase [Bacteroidetes bacterium]|nr:transposase [Bacteroidota bacterium]
MITSDPEVIADLYKRRWQIETLFKRIKQRYPLKYFLGDNPNAIEIQIWATLICDLLVRIIQKTVNQTGNKHWAYSTISGMIRQHLMNYFNIIDF